MIPGIHNNAALGAHLKRAKQRETEQIPGKLKLSMSQQSLHGAGSSSAFRRETFSPDGRKQNEFLNNIMSDANIEKH